MESHWLQEKLQRALIVENGSDKIWLIEIDEFDTVWKDIYCWLPVHEKKKASSIKIQSSKIRFIIRKGITRRILGDELGMQPDAVPIQYNGKHKPYIFKSRCNFNISHSSKYLMVGITYRGEIGVDVQMINMKKKCRFELVFSEHEVNEYKRMDYTEQELFFWKTFVVKEAVTKAMGDGMTVNFCDIEMMKQNHVTGNEVMFHYKKDVNIKAVINIAMTVDYAFAYVIVLP